jgi:phospholipase D1/2
MKHRGAIKKWSSAAQDLYCTSPAWCSWCFEFGPHVLIRSKRVGRDEYQCNTCGGATIKCKGCEIAFCRMGKYINDLYCSKCRGKIDRWEDMDKNKQKYQHKIPRKNNPNRAYAPIRTKINAQWYVDGRDVYKAMIERIQDATHHVYMSFWIMVPTIYVFRDGEHRNKEDRLDYILKKKADEGVKFYFLLWDETNLLMNNMSKMNKQFLEGLSPNIKVMRHPQFKPLQWSHHQKFVVIDDKHAFAGGVDFSTGRFDWHEHHVVDPEAKYWWGIDFYAPQVKKTDQTTDPDQVIVDQSNITRMPWHDIQMYVDGLAARDLAWNFVQRWNHHKKTTQKYAEKEKYPVLSVPDEEFYIAYDQGLAEPETEEEETNVQSSKDASSSSSSSSGKHRHGNKEGKQKHVVFAEDSEVELRERLQVEEPNASEHKRKNSGSNSSNKVITKKWDKNHGSVTVQCVRSMCEWSGATRLESSLLGAYIDAIKNAQYFVYIENQFLVSSPAGGGVENDICQAIIDRISKAIERRETFRCIILLTQPEDLSHRVVPLVQYEYYTINRGETSMVSQLKSRHPNARVEDYLGFYQLRNYGFINDVPLTDQIFVHSKIMIVDDRISIIASANINDRSFVGYRDSEIGIVVLDDEHEVESTMDGKPFAATNFSHSFRSNLFMEHLGLDFNNPEHQELVADPIKSSFFHDVWDKIAEDNTQIFESVFPNIPQNSITLYDNFEALKTAKPRLENAHKLKQVKGHLMKFPLGFLSGETTKFWETFIDSAIFQ